MEQTELANKIIEYAVHQRIKGHISIMLEDIIPLFPDCSTKDIYRAILILEQMDYVETVYQDGVPYFIIVQPALVMDYI